jgi:hypothetical protein
LQLPVEPLADIPIYVCMNDLYDSLPEPTRPGPEFAAEFRFEGLAGDTQCAVFADFLNASQNYFSG